MAKLLFLLVTINKGVLRALPLRTSSQHRRSHSVDENRGIPMTCCKHDISRQTSIDTSAGAVITHHMQPQHRSKDLLSQWTWLDWRSCRRPSVDCFAAVDVRMFSEASRGFVGVYVWWKARSRWIRISSIGSKVTRQISKCIHVRRRRCPHWLR